MTELLKDLVLDHRLATLLRYLCTCREEPVACLTKHLGKVGRLRLTSTGVTCQLPTAQVDTITTQGSL